MTHSGAISGHSTNNLENNLDALLEDLQTSVSRSATPSGRRPVSPHVDFKTVTNKSFAETRSGSPIRTTTTEKYVSTTPAGIGSGISGLEALDAELRNIQPGQAKTVAYKQVSYQFNKTKDGQKIDSFGSTDNSLSSTTKSIDGVHETAYDETYRRPRSPERSTTSKTVNRELVYGDTSSRLIPSSSSSSGTNTRDVKIIRETYQPESSKTMSSLYQNHERIDERGINCIPEHLTPGPNTKVTKTVKTYTYELPGTPDVYRRHNNTEQSVTYKIDKNIERSKSPMTYTSQQPDVKSTILHKEAKYYHEDMHDSSTYGKPKLLTTYPSASSPTNYETIKTKKENYYIRDERYENGYIPVDRVDYPHTETTTTTVIDRVEEFIPDKSSTPNGGHSYYTTTVATPQTRTTSQGLNSSVYKYSKETHSDREILLPKPFPTGTQMYPVNRNNNNDQSSPKRIDDLMASFSDSEREVLVDVRREEKMQQNERHKDNGYGKKEVDFVPHTPAQVNSKNISGPPVYYPPGSGEFKMKEERSMIQGGGEWAKARGAYEYEASSKSKKSEKSGKAVVPVCLPLCCALPCVIM